MATSLPFPHVLSPASFNSCFRHYAYPPCDFVQFKEIRLQNNRTLTALSKKKIAETLVEGVDEKEEVAKRKTSKTPKRGTARTGEKAKKNTSVENSEVTAANDSKNDESLVFESIEIIDKTQRQRRSKAASASTSLVEEKAEKKTRGRRKTVKKIDTLENNLSQSEVSDHKESTIVSIIEDENEENLVAASASTSLVEEKAEKKTRGRRKTVKKIDTLENNLSQSEVSGHEESTIISFIEDENEENLDLGDDEDDNVSDTYGWPPLVCCFGAVQHAFVPSARPANRLVDYEIYERMKDAVWAPEKFFRAPGGSAGSVALALASLGGKVAFMGKLGDDDYGQTLLYYMNVNNVQTRSVKLDGKKATAISHMKIRKRGRLRTTCLKPCAEDSLLKSDINIDVLKEAKMFYFSTHSLLDPNMRLSTLRAIKISKKLGGVVFYDLNLPMPLWKSGEETKIFIQQVWNLADVIEITKQELEFLCGIKSSEEFDTKNNCSSKFVHYEPEVIAPLWHENLKVLFVTNGTSKIHYYTKESDGAILGMEEPPITPFTCDMSASGDGIVAGLLRMLTVQPHLITDKGYLEHTIKYAISCGIIDQWALSRTRDYPPYENMDMEDITPDENGIISITEKEFRTLERVS